MSSHTPVHFDLVFLSRFESDSFSVLYEFLPSQTVSLFCMNSYPGILDFFVARVVFRWLADRARLDA